MAQNPAAVTTNQYALPPARVICTFLDGGVGLYDLGRRKWDFLRDQGHIETIFDCQFKPDDCDLLATASFDGTVKVWDINSWTAKYTSPDNQGIIYSLSWAPSDLNCILGSTSKNGHFIWDIQKGKIIKRFKEHGTSPVYSVAWNQKDARRIMSCSGDGYCLIQQPDGELIRKYHHPGAVYGCDWNPHDKDMLATGCEDKCVRIYHLSTASRDPVKVFTGHTSKVFHIRWSKLREGILCSGSDDMTVRVWDYGQDTCLMVLRGHEGPVRGLVWNSELPYILVSGSWDRSIRVWDTRDGACVDVVWDHGSDVYGLAYHPSRPFLLASASRDSTIRLWSLTSLAQPTQLNILVQKPWSQIIGAVESAMSLGTEPFLTGKVSKELKMKVEKTPDEHSRTIQAFSYFFTPPNGIGNLWDLVSVIQGKDTSILSPSYSSGIVHAKHITRYKASEAQELEMVKMSQFGGGIGAPTKEERLREAASIHIKLGNIQRYCELMVELGEWEKALSIAPGVSKKYWTSLTRRYAHYLVAEGSDKAIPHCAATGDASMLANFLTHQGQILEAVLVAQVACEDCYPKEPLEENIQMPTLCNGLDVSGEENKRLLFDSTAKLAKWYFHNGSPTLAACCHLSVGDCQKAMSKLIRGHELELAVAMGMVLGNVPDQTAVALEMLSRRCEHLGNWELAIELLKLTPNNDLALAKCCARCAGSMNEINFIHQLAGIPTEGECLNEAEKLRTKLDMFECIKYYILSDSPQTGLELGLQAVKSKLRDTDWTASSVHSILDLISSMRSDKLQQHKCLKMMNELLVLCAYVGAFLAIRRHYHCIVPALFSHARLMLTKHDLEMPFTETDILRWKEAWSHFHNSLGNTKREDVPTDMSAAYEELLRRAGTETSAMEHVEVGMHCMVSSNLPSHSDIHTSCLTGERIKGMSYFLEDGTSAVSINEALMWAKVNPFSPLGSGLRINPY
ncbi:hypothetical protein ScPMuIL_010396 [Solemya velum]